MAEGQRQGTRDSGRRSDVLEAIFDRVDEADAADVDPRTTLFRAAALERLDVPLEVDTLLPLTSRRSWLLVVGAIALIVASVGYAAATTVTESVAASGRALAGGSGVVMVAAPVDGVVTGWSVEPGAEVGAGAGVLVMGSQDGSVTVSAVAEGSLWQQLVTAGDAVRAGDAVATLLPPGSDRIATLAVSEPEAAAVVPGAAVRLGGLSGTVTAVAPGPLPAAVAAGRLSLGASDLAAAVGSADAPVVLVTVELDAAVVPGTVLSGDIVIDRSSLLSRIF